MHPLICTAVEIKINVKIGLLSANYKRILHGREGIRILSSSERYTFSTRRENPYPQAAMLCSVYFIYIHRNFQGRDINSEKNPSSRWDLYPRPSMIKSHLELGFFSELISLPWKFHWKFLWIFPYFIDTDEISTKNTLYLFIFETSKIVTHRKIV